MVTIRPAGSTAPDVLVDAAEPFLPHLLRDYAARCAETGRVNEARRARMMADEVADWQRQHPPPPESPPEKRP